MPKKHTFTATISNAGGGGAFVEIKNSEFYKNSEFCLTLSSNPEIFLSSPESEFGSHPK